MIERNGWSMLVIPAIASDNATYRIGPQPSQLHHRREGDLLLPERDTVQELNKTRLLLGSFNYAAQYQQEPVPSSGNLIKREWLRTFSKEPKRFHRKIVSWDTASTIGPRSSYSVGVVMGKLGTNYFVLYVILGRFEPGELRRLIVDTHRTERANATLIEKTDHGRLLSQSLRAAGELGPILMPVPRKSKSERLSIEAPKFEAGQVWLPDEAPWLAPYVSELVGFPNVAHNDQVDSTTQALAHLNRLRSSPRPDTTGMYGPTGRRTRASLTRHAPAPKVPVPDPDEEADAWEAQSPVELIVRKVTADWELPSEQLVRRRRR